MNKYEAGVFIARFQPPHPGHITALRQGLKQTDSVSLVIGSANKLNPDNPLTLAERLELLTIILKEEQLDQFIREIVPLNDIDEDDNAWLRLLESATKPFQLVISNNPWVNDVTQTKYAQCEPELTEREKYQGYVIRQAIIEGRSWKDLVFPYTLPYLEKIGFEKRVRDYYAQTSEKRALR